MAAANSIDDPVALIMFDKVIASDKIIKSQQRGDPELSVKDKTEILSDILLNSPGSFLVRFGVLFDDNDLQYFTGSTDYEVQHYVKELRNMLQGDNKKKRTNNRRYKAIEELSLATDYFTDREMRERCPLLYEQYIGQFLTEEEKDRVSSCRPGELSLSAHIANKLDNDITTEKLLEEQRKEKRTGDVLDTNDSVLTLSNDPNEAEDDKLMLRKEFLRLMHLRFINGEEDYSYESVDHNEEYDVSSIKARDEEELYFDSEEPSHYLNMEDSSCND